MATTSTKILFGEGLSSTTPWDLIGFLMETIISASFSCLLVRNLNSFDMLRWHIAWLEEPESVEMGELNRARHIRLLPCDRLQRSGVDQDGVDPSQIQVVANSHPVEA